MKVNKMEQKIKFDEIERSRLEDLLIEISIAQVFFEERPHVWIRDEEAPELEGALEEGAEVDDILLKIKNKFPNQIAYWFKMEDEDGSAYYLIPKLFGYCGSKQYLLRKCPKCEVWLSETTICTSPTPWDCAHGSVLYCANCGAGVDVEGAVHGPHGAELTQEEVDLLLKFFSGE